jgi:hypothetical protein
MPDRSPPAGPVGLPELKITSGPSLANVIDPSRTFVVVTELSAS